MYLFRLKMYSNFPLSNIIDYFHRIDGKKVGLCIRKITAPFTLRGVEVRCGYRDVRHNNIMRISNLEYAPPIVAFVALATSIGGPLTWDATHQGLGQITALGWITITIGVIAMVISFVLTFKNHRKIDLQKQQHLKLRLIGDSEIRIGLKQLTWLYFDLFGNENENSHLELVPKDIENPDVLQKVLKVDIRTEDRPFFGGIYGMSWAEVFKLNADLGITRIDRALQIYTPYLKPSVVESLSDLRSCEFLMLRIARLDELVEMNKDVKFLTFPFPGSHSSVDDLTHFGYKKFWDLIRRLDSDLIKDEAKLKRRL